MSKSALVEIDITQLFPDPSQPRKVFDEKAIEALREDIKANGLTVPIDINPLLDGRKTKYLIIDGECRFHAIEGIDDFGMVPCKLHTYKSQRQIDKHRASVHFHRKDWNPADRAVWLKYYTETHKLRQQDLAREFSVTHSTVSQWIAPTRDARVLKALRNEEIGFTQAITLSRVDDAETREKALLESIGKTKRETEEIVNRLHSTPESDIPVKDAEVKERFAETGEDPQLPQVEDHPPSATETVDEGEGDETGSEEATPPPETTGIVAETLGIEEKGTEGEEEPEREAEPEDVEKPDDPKSEDEPPLETEKPKVEEKKKEPQACQKVASLSDYFQKQIRMRSFLAQFRVPSDKRTYLSNSEDALLWMGQCHDLVASSLNGESQFMCRVKRVNKEMMEILKREKDDFTTKEAETYDSITTELKTKIEQDAKRGS